MSSWKTEIPRPFWWKSTNSSDPQTVLQAGHIQGHRHWTGRRDSTNPDKVSLVSLFSIFSLRLHKKYECQLELDERRRREENWPQHCGFIHSLLLPPLPVFPFSLSHTRWIDFTSNLRHTHTHTLVVESHKCTSWVQRSDAAVLLLEKVVTWGSVRGSKWRLIKWDQTACRHRSFGYQISAAVWVCSVICVHMFMLLGKKILI